MNKTQKTADKITSLLSVCKSYPDFPKPGVNFIDFFSLIRNPSSTALLLSACAEAITDFSLQNKAKITTVAGLESRGAILGALLANHLKLGFVPIRKKNKLPGEKFMKEYSTEYSMDVIEIQKDALSPTDKVLIVDDLLATGGTLNAAAELVATTGAEVAGLFCVFTVKALDGISRLDLKEKYVHLTYI